MFKDSNLVLFLLCLIPAVFYALTIFLHSPPFSIRLKSSFVYLYTGLLSVTILKIFFFLFPHIHDPFFLEQIGAFKIEEKEFKVMAPTILTVLTYAFVQVAFMEELSKWLAFKCSGYMRGITRKNLDHPYSTMFYCALTAAGFAILENTQYASQALAGEFGPSYTAENLLILRGMTSVVTHMICGLFMGYFISLGKGLSKLKQIGYNILGILSAVTIHGLYDFSIFWKELSKFSVEIKGITLHIPSIIIIACSLPIALLMSNHLKRRKAQIES